VCRVLGLFQEHRFQFDNQLEACAVHSLEFVLLEKLVPAESLTN